MSHLHATSKMQSSFFVKKTWKTSFAVLCKFIFSGLFVAPKVTLISTTYLIPKEPTWCQSTRTRTLSNDDICEGTKVDCPSCVGWKRTCRKTPAPSRSNTTIWRRQSLFGEESLVVNLAILLLHARSQEVSWNITRHIWCFFLSFFCDLARAELYVMHYVTNLLSRYKYDRIITKEHYIIYVQVP